MKRIVFLILSGLLLASCTQKPTNTVAIVTNFGTIKVRLYDDTPIHRDHFKQLVSDGFYEGILFHRVIPQFVIQAGDIASKNAVRNESLGAAYDRDTVIDAEILPQHFHRRGVLAAAREGDNINPQRKSSGTHFYIAIGKVFRSGELDSTVEGINNNRREALFNRVKETHENAIRKAVLDEDYDAVEKIHEDISAETQAKIEGERLILTDEQREAYTTVGGIPHLDGAYTVFGEVIEGMEVVDRIAAQKTNPEDRPLEDVVILKTRFE